MAKKKDEPKQSTEQELLEQRVDAMMDYKHSESSPGKQAEPANSKTDDTLPPLDIFSESSAPDVPKELLKGTSIKKAAAKNTDVAPPPTKVEQPASDETARGTSTEAGLDDAVSDAAVDDIVAKEGDAVLATEDQANKEQEPAELPKKKVHRHPVFWTLVTILAILIVLLAVLLVTGGNVKAPGTKGGETLWHSLRQRL